MRGWLCLLQTYMEKEAEELMIAGMRKNAIGASHTHTITDFNFIIHHITSPTTDLVVTEGLFHYCSTSRDTAVAC